MNPLFCKIRSYSFDCQVNHKKLTTLASFEIASMQPIFKIKMLFYQSKANLDEKILFGKVTHYLNSEIKKKLVRVLYRNEHSTLHSGPCFTCY